MQYTPLQSNRLPAAPARLAERKRRREDMLQRRRTRKEGTLSPLHPLDTDKEWGNQKKEGKSSAGKSEKEDNLFREWMV
tara:strand:+ start:134 stop:370 length:237 start_codon:yes stop_codon:yes gene_type:complete